MASLSSSPPHAISHFFMTGLCVKKKLIKSCWPTTDLSERCFHIFPPAATWTGKSHLWDHAFALLQVLFQCASKIPVACAPGPFLSCVLSCQTPERDAHRGLGLQTTAGPRLKPACSATAQMHFSIRSRMLGRIFHRECAAPPRSQRLLDKS